MPKEMSKRERVEAALSLQPTDRIPVYDLIRNDAIIQHFAGTSAVAGEEGLKAVCKATAGCLDMTRSLRTPGKNDEITDSDGLTWQRARWTEWIVHRPFSDLDGARAYVEKKIRDFRQTDVKETAKAALDDFHKLTSYFGDDTVLLLRCSGVGLDWVRRDLDWEFFSYLSMDEPGLISEFLDAYTDLEVEIIHAIADPALSPCALTYGDIAYKNALLHSPEWLRREFFPRLKRLNDAYHEHGIKCLFHSDGYLMEVMPDLIASDIDGLNPIETLAGMSVQEVKRLYGDTIFLTGGIDVSQLLAYGSSEEVSEVCREAVATAAPGYFIGSTTELHNDVRLENWLALLEVADGIWQSMCIMT